MSQRRHSRIFLTAAIIGALTVFVYWPALYNGFVRWDDPTYLETVSRLQRVSLSSIRWIATALLPLYYHPVTWFSHLMDFQLWGWNLAGHHASSILLHGANTALVCLFVWSLTGAIENLSESTRFAMATGVAVAFGIHPLQVESVAWLAERKTVLCGLFSLMCLCAYLKAVAESGLGACPEAVDEAPAAKQGKPRSLGKHALPATRNRGWWWVMTVLFLAALLSKPLAVSLPVVMLVLDYYPLRRQMRENWRALVKEKLALFACCVAMGVLTIVSQSRAGAVTGVAGFGLLARCLVAARNVVFYLWKLVWPAWLSPYYPLEGKIPLGDAEFVVPIIGVILVSAFAFSQRRRIPQVWAAWCGYVAMLAPVSGLMQAGGQGAGDRFMYLPMVPPLLLAAAACVWLSRHFSLLGRGALAALLGCVLLFFGLRTRGQIAIWHDDETLWTAAVRYFPNSVLANWKLSLALMEQHRYEEAQTCAQKAARLNPTYGPMRATLGEIYVKTHQYSEALAELQEALRLKPNMPECEYALACAYARLNRLDDACRTLQQLLVVDPSYARAMSDEEELAALRASPDFSARLRALLDEAGTK